MIRMAHKIREAIKNNPEYRSFFMFRHIETSSRFRAGLDAYLKKTKPDLFRKRKGTI